MALIHREVCTSPKASEGYTLAFIASVPSAPIAVAPYVKTLQPVSSWQLHARSGGF